MAIHLRASASKPTDFATTIHGPNERIPTDAIRFGTEAIYSLLILYGRTV